MHCVAIPQNFLCSYGVKANLLVDDIAEIISELTMFKQAGGGTLCDVSPFGVRWVLSLVHLYDTNKGWGYEYSETLVQINLTSQIKANKIHDYGVRW